MLDVFDASVIDGKINGQVVYLWRAVDQSGEVLEILVQKRRNARAAKRFLRKSKAHHRCISYGRCVRIRIGDDRHHNGAP